MDAGAALAFARRAEDERLDAIVVAAQRYNAATLDAAALVALHPHTVAALDAPRRCVRCGQQYQRVATLGRWSCRRTHDGMWNAVGERWECCGATSVNARACLAMDHRDTEAADAAYIVVPHCFSATMLRDLPRASVVPAAAVDPRQTAPLVVAADVPASAAADLYWREMRRGALLVATRHRLAPPK